MSAVYPLPPHGHMAHVNDIEMYYEDHGAGEPLVLLHGFTLSHTMWDGHLPYLTPHYRVLSVDLRGHGRSTNPRDTFRHDQAARDVYALLDALGIGRFRAMGFSSGSMVLLHMATKQPERVQAMVHISGTTYCDTQTRQVYASISPENPTMPWEQLAKWHLLGDDQIRKLMTQFHGFKDVYDDVNFTPPYLSTITAPTLIIHGDRDPFFEVSIPVGLYRAIAHAYLWILPNWGHATPRAGSEALKALFAETVLAFLAGEWEAT